MENSINCNIIVKIDSIDKLEGSNQNCEIYITTVGGGKAKIVFKQVWDCRFAIENAFMDRASKIVHHEHERSSVLLITGSKYIRYFEKEVSGTRPINRLKDYILFDNVDTVVEILSNEEPALIMMQ